MNVLALIPARGGSKGIPRKNIAMLAGRPLISYTIDAALSSKSVNRVVVSTDEEEIAGVSRSLGAEIPFMRPASLSGDAVSAQEVISHSVHFLEQVENWAVDYVIYLQPTSPLRTAIHIDQGIDAMIESGADCLASVTKVPHQFNPQSLLKKEKGKLVPLGKEKQVLRRQEKETFYARNGPAVLILRRSWVGEEDLYSGNAAWMEMDQASSIDIDCHHDLGVAEYFLRRAEDENRCR